MAHTRLKLVIPLAALGLVFGACGDEDTAERTADTAEDAAEQVGETADDALATFRTSFERLVDSAATGDDEARDQLLDECRATLEDLRQADDQRAERVGQLCDDIRDANEGTAWDEVRQEFEEIDLGG